jgi:hypothetical protein
MSPRPRLIAVSLAGLLALSLAPSGIGQAAPAVSAALGAVPQEYVSPVSTSRTSTGDGRVDSASALTFTNRTTTNGLGSDVVYGVYAVGSTVYAATGGGLSISTDGGATFTNRTTANGLGGNFVSAVYALGGTVYAATYGGVSISTDGGASFTNRTSGLGSIDVRGVFAVDDTVYAATLPDVAVGGVSISTDGGATFTNRTSGPSPGNGLGSNVVRGVYAVGSTVYAATSGGVSISTDGGATFTNSTSGLGNNSVNGVFAMGSTVYAATNGGGLSISTDGGATFTNRTTADGLGSNVVQGVYAVGSTVYAATSGGLSISTDGGATFTNHTTANGLESNLVLGVYADGGTVYAATDKGLSISGSSLPALTALPASASVVAGATTTVTISSTAQPIPDDTVINAVSSAPGVAAVTSSVNASGGSATFTVTGVSAGTSNVTFSAAGYANVVVPVTVTAPEPGPNPVFPPSAPLSVIGGAGDGSVELSWETPSSVGSFPVTNYQAVVSPGGQSCLVAAPALTCTITGLTNGTAYTATVRALNGAGWGEWSASSAEVTPAAPSIMISGTRAEVRGRPGVVVTGTTTGFGMGAILRPWVRFPGQTSYTQGTANILVDVDSSFTWQRRTGKKIYISLRSADGEVHSNRLIMDRR